MYLIRPLTIDSSNLTSNVALDDGGEYSSTATYALGDVVIDTATTYHAYESLADSNTGNALTDSASWLDHGAVNRLAMFDQVVGTVTENSSIDVTIAGTSVLNGLALFNLDAQSVQVTVTNASGTLYDETVSLRSTFGITDWYAWFTQEISYKSDMVLTDLPPNSGTNVRVQITSTSGSVSCGTMVLGKLRSLGTGPFYGLRGGITDYSRKTTDDFGNATLVERPYAKRISYNTMVPNGDIDGVFNALTDVRATPSVWIGVTDYGMTSTYGWPRDWGITISYPTQSLLSLEIEGLI